MYNVDNDLNNRLSPAQYSLPSAESWPKTPFIYLLLPDTSGVLCAKEVEFIFMCDHPEMLGFFFPNYLEIG